MVTEAAEFNELIRQGEKAGRATLLCWWKAGEIASRAKKVTKHGDWMQFVEENYNADIRSVERWMKFHANVSISKIDTVSSLTEGIKLLDAPKKPKKPPKPSGGGTPRTDSGAATETTPETPSAGTEDPGDIPFDPDEAPWDEEAAIDEKVEAAKKIKNLADQHRDKLARAICDYNELIPNQAERVRLVNIVQDVHLWV